jgi:hypothetical protein
MDEFIKDVHYYMDGIRVVFTTLYHIERGKCCGNKCLHCPFIPKHQKDNTQIDEEFLTVEN